MSAGKLSRFAGLVFVLAAVIGGISAAASATGHETGGSVTAASQQLSAGDIIWA